MLRVRVQYTMEQKTPQFKSGDGSKFEFEQRARELSLHFENRAKQPILDKDFTLVSQP